MSNSPVAQALTFEDLKKLNGTQLDQIGYVLTGGNTGANLSPYILGYVSVFLVSPQSSGP